MVHMVLLNDLVWDVWLSNLKSAKCSQSAILDYVHDLSQIEAGPIVPQNHQKLLAQRILGQLSLSWSPPMDLLPFRLNMVLSCST